MTALWRGLWFIAGLLGGGVLVLAGLYVFPFAFERRTEALLPAFSTAQTEHYVLRIPGDMVMATHGGRMPFKPMPEGVALLDAENLANTFALVTKFRNRPDGPVIGFGTELEMLHEGSSFLLGRLMTHTFWSVVVPGRGTVHLYETENNWQLFKRVVLPMKWSGKAFEGRFLSVNTYGPRPGYRGMIVAGTGEFAGRQGEFIEIGRITHMGLAGDLKGLMELRLTLPTMTEQDSTDE